MASISCHLEQCFCEQACLSGDSGEFSRSGLAGVESQGCRGTHVRPHKGCQMFQSSACSDNSELWTTTGLCDAGGIILSLYQPGDRL